MTNMNTEGLPPEMQQRIADIIAQAKGSAGAAPARPQLVAPDERQAFDQVQAQPQERPVAPPVRQPSLMDHTIALRQDLNALRQELRAVAQVTEAVGQAVGELYACFQTQTTPSNFSSNFQAQGQGQVEEY